jgi:hypothetical protein
MSKSTSSVSTKTTPTTTTIKTKDKWGRRTGGVYPLSRVLDATKLINEKWIRHQKRSLLSNQNSSKGDPSGEPDI